MTVSCSNRQNTLNYYENYPVKFAKQKVEHPNGDFSIFIPINWECKTDDYDNKNILLGLNASPKPEKEGNVNTISIQKIQSFGNKTDLKSEYEYCLNLVETNWTNAKIIETGLTDFLDDTAYVLHTKSDTEIFGKIETISLILESDTKGVFYNLVACVSQTDDLKKNMAILVKCLRTFKMNKSE